MTVTQQDVLNPTQENILNLVFYSGKMTNVGGEHGWGRWPILLGVSTQKKYIINAKRKLCDNAELTQI